MRSPTATAGVSIATLGTVLYSLGQWLVIAILTRAADPHYVGLFSLVLAVSAPILILGALGLRQAFVTDQADSKVFGRYYTLRLITTVGSLVAITIWCVATDIWGFLTIWILLSRAVDLVTDIFLGPFQSKKDLARIGISQAINGVVTPGVMAVLWWLGLPNDLVSTALVWGSLAALVYVFRCYSRERSFPKPELDFVGLWPMFRQTLPLGLSAMLVSFYANVPRYFLDYQVGLEAVGLFSAVIYFSLAGNAVVSAVAQLALPTVTDYLRESRTAEAVKFTLLAAAGFGAIGLLVTTVSLFLGDEILSLVYPPEYANGTVLAVSLIAWTIGACAWMVEVLLTASRKFRFQLYSSICALAAMLLSAPLLIPSFGIVGAAWAMVCGASAQLLSRVFFATLTVWQRSGSRARTA